MSCNIPKPIFPSPYDVGIKNVIPQKDGYTIEINWNYALPSYSSNAIGYNIYYSLNMNDVFNEGTKLFTQEKSLNINGFSSGDVIYFSIRATEYDPTIQNYNSLPISIHSSEAYTYPTTLLANNIDDVQLDISLIDGYGFPTYGLLQIGAELIQYENIDYQNNIIYAKQRGYYNTQARIHNVDGYDGYKYQTPIIGIFNGFEDGNSIIAECQTRYEPEEFPYTINDGYKQVTEDILTTDLVGSDNYNENFPSYDYSSYHKTNIIDYFSGHCIGSYAGGEYGCADGYKERGFDLERESNKRLEMELDVVGEPVILLKRLWTGIRCNCFKINQEYPETRCPICFGTGFVGGYEQYYSPRYSDKRIKVKFEPTIDDLSAKPQGLQQNFVPNCWTLVVPAIKDRDVLIRFNQDGTEEFRYEVVNVTRNKLLFSLYGAQKMQVYRIDKTDMVYQWRALKDNYNSSITYNTTLGELRGYGLHMHTINVPGNILNINNLNCTTDITAGHSHTIINGKIQEMLGHVHDIIIN